MTHVRLKANGKYPRHLTILFCKSRWDHPSIALENHPFKARKTIHCASVERPLVMKTVLTTYNTR